MAHSGWHQHAKKSSIADFEAFATFLLSTAEDDDDEINSDRHTNLTNTMAIKGHMITQNQRIFTE